MDYKLCEGDFRFMTVIWDNEPLGSGELVKLCRQKFDWKKSTTYTMLKKMLDKGLAQNIESVVTSLVPRERVQAYMSENFVEKTFSNSLPSFLVAFLGGKTVTEKEAEEIKKLIDQHKER